MFRYNLNNLSPETFAKLCNALLIETVSSEIRPFDTVGPDGGRDCDYIGRGENNYQNLEGYWIFQYKHHDVTRLGVTSARQAVRREFRETLDKLFTGENRAPDIFILLTNVPFSGVPSSGLHDWFTDTVSEYGLKHAEVWDYTKLEALIDNNYEVRGTFFPELTYEPTFFKEITDRVSSSIFWEGLQTLFHLEGDSTPLFRSRDEYEATKDRLWIVYENLSTVAGGLATITNYIYSWPELAELADIAAQHPDFEIRLGEHHWIKRNDGSAGGGSRNVWSVMRILVPKIEGCSAAAHRAIMELSETTPSVARIVANAATAHFESHDYMAAVRSTESLLTPLQFIRFESVNDVLKSLARVLTLEEHGYQGSLEGAWESSGICQ